MLCLLEAIEISVTGQGCSEGHYTPQRTVIAVRSDTHVSLVFPAYTYIYTHISHDPKKKKSPVSTKFGFALALVFS